MKSCFRIFVCFCLLVPFVSPAQNFNAKTVLPKNLSQYRFGMSLDDFTKKNKSATTAEGNMSFRIEYLDKDAGNDIKQVLPIILMRKIINPCMK